MGYALPHHERSSRTRGDRHSFFFLCREKHMKWRFYLPSGSKQRRSGRSPPPVLPNYPRWLTEDVESVGGSLVWRESSTLSHHHQQRLITGRTRPSLRSVSVLIINVKFSLWSSENKAPPTPSLCQNGGLIPVFHSPCASIIVLFPLKLCVVSLIWT